jgi:hypothetical protein
MTEIALRDLISRGFDAETVSEAADICLGDGGYDNGVPDGKWQQWQQMRQT